MTVNSTIEFFLNGKKQVLRNPDPTQTVLAYVRSIGLTGTKLGCQEGGCGACTVTLSEWNPESQKPHYYAINGCIVPLIAVDGKHLVTVEGIGNSKTPHAVQERIAKFHGSQCGFCTPGIVMSLYSLLREEERPTREQISEAFDGNLCRCTGYKPILDAAGTFADDGTFKLNGKLANGESNVNGRNESESNGGCCGGAGPNGGCCKDKGASACGKSEVGYSGSSLKNLDGMREYPHAELIFPPALKKFEPKLLKLEDEFGKIWYRPTTLNELVELLKKFPAAKMVAGASEFQIEAKIKGDQHPVCIYVLDVPELKTFKHIPGRGVRIGGDLALSILEEKLEQLNNSLPASQTQFYQAVVAQLKYFAGRQIRNVATAAGNIATASPISDLNPVFVSANVELETLDPTTGETIKLRMGDFEKPFFVGYRKTLLENRLLITHLTIPESQEGDVVQTFKQAKRKDDDISIVTASMYAHISHGLITEARLAYGGVAPFTVLAKSSKQLFEKPIDIICSKGIDSIIESLNNEFNLPYSVPGGMAVFRRSLILSFFYKFSQRILQHIGLNAEADVDALADVTRTNEPIGVRENKNEFEQKIYGQKTMHVNAMRQVTGEVLYVDDIPEQARELYAVQVMSTKARAEVINVDYSAALEVEGVVGKVDIEDVPGSNRFGIFPQIGPERLFAEGKVEYIGDTVGLIVAKSRKVAEYAARLVKIEYKEDSNESPIVTIEQAIERNSFFDIKNEIKKGNFEEAWENAKYRFEGTTRTGAQEHFYLEPQGCLVVPEDNGFEYKIYSSTQNPTESQLVAASSLGIPASRVVCRVKRLGGGFGGKESTSVNTSSLAVVAAHKFNTSVRLILSRSEDMVKCGQRHPFLSKWRVTLDENYKFTGLEVRLFANAGYSMDLSKGVIDRAALHVDNCYNFGDNIDIVSRPCRTNLATNTAFRGFGGPQGMMVAENIIHELSERLHLSEPEVLRRINYYPTDGTGRTHYQQWLGDDFTVPVMMEQLREKTKFDNMRREVDEFNKKSKWIKRGLSSIPTKFGIAFGVPHLNQAGALVHIYEDGSVLLTHGGTEMGQGLHTKMVMVCAAELGVEIEDVFISETATNTVANTSPTAASASSDLNGMAVKNACDILNERLKPIRERLGPKATLKDIAHTAHLERINLSANGFYKMPDIGYKFDNLYENPDPPGAFLYYTQGCAVSLVEVDTLTGDWANLRTDIIMDIGRLINQAIDYGQIEGAFVQGQGLFTLEESLWTPQGSLLTRGPGAYKIPGFRDMPQNFNVEHLQGRDYKHLKSINRSKGIGEPPLFLGSAPMFALRDAINSTRKSHNLPIIHTVDAPFTTERIRVAFGDKFAQAAQVEVKGQPFSVRS